MKKTIKTYYLIYGAKNIPPRTINCFANSKDEAVEKIKKYIDDNKIIKVPYFCVCNSENDFLVDFELKAKK